MYDLLDSFKEASLDVINKIKEESLKKFPSDPVAKPVNALILVGKKKFVIESDKIITQIYLMQAELELLVFSLKDHDEEDDYYRRYFGFLLAVISVLVEYELFNQ